MGKRLNNFLNKINKMKQNKDSNLENDFEEFQKKIDQNGISKLSALHMDFGSCDNVYRITKGNPLNNELPLNLGKVENKDMYLVGFGDEAPFHLSKVEFLYLVASITKGANELLGDQGEDLKDLTKELINNKNNAPFLGKGKGNKSMSIEDLANMLNTKPKDSSEEQKDDLDLNSYSAAKEQAEDMEEIFNSLSPEEKQKVSNDISKKKEELIYDKVKALEKDLMGDIEEETPITYDYAYFKKIHKEKGTETMREELAKIPKEERKDIINKIVEEVKQETKTENDKLV